jgi:ssDNA-binding Zn-finger/Zn-ribbon topoisomerase 1
LTVTPTLEKTTATELKACPNCRKLAGELKKSELGSRFPYYVKCNACGWGTDMVRLPGVAVKLWNDAKALAKARQKRGSR